MDEPWLTRDYRSWWRPPDPMPPARWPRVVLVLEVVVVIVAAFVTGHQPAPRYGWDEVRRQIVAEAE
jgi:hypothetical protein